jgi:hypothetical protein
MVSVVPWMEPRAVGEKVVTGDEGVMNDSVAERNSVILEEETLPPAPESVVATEEGLKMMVGVEEGAKEGLALE